MKNNPVKYFFLFAIGLGVRLLPFRAPNLEPLMAMVMPISRSFNLVASFLFGVFSIAIYDLLTVGFGVWTIVAGLAYGLVGVAASLYFRNRSGWRNYAKFAFYSTIVFDIATGLSMGPIFFDQPLLAAVLGQIPFTLIHLLSNVSFAILLSPMIEKWLVKKDSVVPNLVGVSA